MSTASETMNIRIKPADRDLIDRAAKATGKNRTEFIIAAAHREAEAVLLDQRLFTLEGKEFDEFVKALDRPPKKNRKLQQLLTTPAPWDK